MGDIIKSMKNMRKELEQNKASFENERNSWNSQQAGSNAKERTL